MKHVLYALMENKPGVLRRISGLFGRRGYNIDSIVASATEDENVTSMTIVVDGDEYILDQVIKQLAKLQEIIDVVNVSDLAAVRRQLLLMKVSAGSRYAAGYHTAGRCLRSENRRYQIGLYHHRSYCGG